MRSLQRIMTFIPVLSINEFYHFECQGSQLYSKNRVRYTRNNEMAKDNERDVQCILVQIIR